MRRACPRARHSGATSRSTAAARRSSRREDGRATASRACLAPRPAMPPDRAWRRTTPAPWWILLPPPSPRRPEQIGHLAVFDVIALDLLPEFLRSADDDLGAAADQIVPHRLFL